jgi:mono/diheme cytochrome c family protein
MKSKPGALPRVPTSEKPKEILMTKMIRSQMVLAAAVCLAGAVCFAQSSGEATYKAKCAMCHGATGTPSPGMAKMMGIKAASDPAIKKLTVAEMTAAIKSGKGKMKPIAGLTDQQIKDVVTYYRGLK